MARKTPEINSSSTADMAFLLLCFFMMTTTMDVDLGLSRRLPPKSKAQKAESQKVNRRNLMRISIRKDNKILASSELESRVIKDMSELNGIIKRFITNPQNDDRLSVNRDTVIDGKIFRISSGVISLQNQRFTRYDTYIEVQNELVRAFNEIRDEVAMRNYGVNYNELDEAKKEIIREVVPQTISEATAVESGKR